MLIYKGRTIIIDNDLLTTYRNSTGMDIDETSIPYYASNEGVDCDAMSDMELSEMVKRGMEEEIKVATEV